MGNETDLVQKTAEESGILDEVFAKFAEKKLDITQKGAAALTAFAVTLAEKVDITLIQKISISGSFGLPLSILTNFGTGSQTTEAVAYAIIDELVTSVSSDLLIGVLAAGEITFATAAASSVGAVVVGYAAVQGIDCLKDTYIGPSAKIVPDYVNKKYNFMVTGGSLSDFIRPRSWFFEEVSWFAENVWEHYDLVHANEWTLSSGNTDEPLTIHYYGKDYGDNPYPNDTFIFNGVPGTTLRDIYNSHIADVLNFDEHKKVINLILQNFGQDFDAVVNGGEPDHVYNLVTKTEQQLYNLATSSEEATAKRTLLALDCLDFFALQSDEYYNSSVDPDDYSDQYIKDRANFLFHLTHVDALASDGNDTTFIDMSLGITKSVGNGTPNPLTDDQLYIFGKGNDLLGEDPVAGNDTINGGSQDDHLYESSPKSFSPHRAVFSLAA